MKHYRVTIDGRLYEVEIDDPRARPVTARLSGTAYSVDIESGQAVPVEPEVENPTINLSPSVIVDFEKTRYLDRWASRASTTL